MRFLYATVGLVSLSLAQQPSPIPADPAKISGKTVNLAGEPVRKTKLVLRPMSTQPDDMPKTYGAVSDAEGKFVFESLPAGKYTLWAEKSGYLRQGYGAKEQYSAGTPISVNAGQTLTDITFQLTPQSTVSGKILDEDGDPVARSHVMLMKRMYRYGKRTIAQTAGAMADEEGEFKLSGVAAGRYYLCASPGFTMAADVSAVDPKKVEEDLVPSCYPNAPDTTTAAAFEVAAGRNVSGMDIRLRKAAVVRVKGRVTGITPGENISVQLFAREPGGLSGAGAGSGFLQKDGPFELRRVQAGSYELVAMRQEGRAAIVARQAIDVGRETIDGVVLSIVAPADLKGLVKMEGTPPQNQPVSLPTGNIWLIAMEGQAFNQPMGMPGPDGAFTLPSVSPGKYRVSVGAPAGMYLKSVRYGDQEVLRTGVDLSSGVAGQLEITFRYGGGEIAGTVKDDKGNVAAGSTVTLIPDPPQPEQTYLYHVLQADQNGQFTFKSLAPGAYRVYAWERLEPGAYMDPDYLKPHSSLSTRVEISEGSHEQADLVRIAESATAH